MMIKRKNMEKSGIVILAAGIILLAACTFGRRHTTIVENTDNHHLRIEYAGHIRFNDKGTDIERISPDGYVEYQKDNEKLEAKNDGHGGVSYELYDGYEKLALDERGRNFITEAVRIMDEKIHRP